MTTSFPNFIKNLNETDYEDWKESLDLYLAIANLNLAMRTEKLGTITDASIEVQRILYEKWEHSNIVCLKVISYTIEKSIRQSIPESFESFQI